MERKVTKKRRDQKNFTVEVPWVVMIIPEGFETVN